MTIEEAKSSGSDTDKYASKVTPQVDSASDTESTLTGRRGTVKTIDCAFDTTEDPRYYKPIPEYEGAHRWDPDFEWTEEEEKAVVKKVCLQQQPVNPALLRKMFDILTLVSQIDWRICTFACITFFALQLDRGNVVQATSDNMLDDLGMNTNDYNTGQTIFLVTFLAAELPSQLLSKWFGPDRWIPIQMVSWSLVAACQAFVKNRSTYFVTRCLLGLLEGGLYVQL